MAPSPRKSRMSPRAKASASPVKRNESFRTPRFDELDFSSLNGSWAEITENDESLNKKLFESASKSEGRRSRKTPLPKKANSKPKFVRSLELTDEFFVNTRRSDRIKEKTSAIVVDKRKLAERSPLQTKESRKRHLSAASSTAVNDDSECCSPTKRVPNSDTWSNGRPARKNQRSDDTTSSPFRNRNLFKSSADKRTSNNEFTPKDFWEDPTLGWCKNQTVLDRRTKEIERAKEKSVYARYLSEVPRHLRVKGVHPRTPNKYINFSRRSWDVQIRSWKRSLYDWAGEEPSESVNTSFCSYSSEECQQEDVEQENRSQSVLRSIREIDEIKVLPETDAMASLLGHFDIDSRRGDESTLKAPTNGCPHDGPVDFSTIDA